MANEIIVNGKAVPMFDGGDVGIWNSSGEVTTDDIALTVHGRSASASLRDADGTVRITVSTTAVDSSRAANDDAVRYNLTAISPELRSFEFRLPSFVDDWEFHMSDNRDTKIILGTARAMYVDDNDPAYLAARRPFLFGVHHAMIALLAANPTLFDDFRRTAATMRYENIRTDIAGHWGDMVLPALRLRRQKSLMRDVGREPPFEAERAPGHLLEGQALSATGVLDLALVPSANGTMRLTVRLVSGEDIAVEIGDGRILSASVDG